MSDYTIKINKLPDYIYLRKVLFFPGNPESEDYDPRDSREYYIWDREPEIIGAAIHAINENCLHGLINSKGETIVPFIYDDIYCDRLRAQPDRRMVVKLTDEAKAEFDMLKRDFMDSYKDEKALWWWNDELYYPSSAYYSKCLCGLIDLSGNELLPLEYQDIIECRGVFLAMKNWLWQIFDPDGQRFSEKEFSRADAISVAVKNGFTRERSPEEEIKLQEIGSDEPLIHSEHTGEVVYCHNGGDWTRHYENSEGKITIPKGRHSIEKVGKKLLRVGHTDYSIYDEDGRVIIEPRQGGIVVTPNGRFVTLSHHQDSWANKESMIYDENSGAYIRLGFTQISETAYETLFLASQPIYNGQFYEGYNGIMRDSGEIILPIEYQFALSSIGDKSPPNFYIGKKDMAWYCIEIEG